MITNSRRLFIKRAALLTIAGFIIDPFKQLFAQTKNEFPDWKELVEYARWCPTVHNLQPHKLKIISETEAELYYDPSRLLPVEDPNGVFATVAMGVFIEHLSIAAAPYNKKIEIITIAGPIKTNGKECTLFARLKLVNNDDKEILPRVLITKRRTSRLHYTGVPLSQTTLDRITTQTNSFEQEFFYSSDKKLVDLIIELNQQTLFDDLGSKDTRDELDHLFRYTKEEAETKRDGLWAKCMGFSGPLIKSVFQHHERWEKGLKKKLLASHYKASFKGTETICWYGGMFNDTNDWIQAGRMLARNWLLLTKYGGYKQPFGSLITNANAYKKINELFTKPTGDKKIWMVFRAGYSEEPTRSYRLNTDEIIIPNP